MHVAGRPTCYFARAAFAHGKGTTVQPDELGREVNRLYWQTDEPVTRLAERLGVARGTFYNHLAPLRASGRCASCGGALSFRRRSERDAGEAHCESCGATQPSTPRSAERAAVRDREPRKLRVERPASETPADAHHTHESALLAARASWLEEPEDAEDRLRTQLIIVAVGAAALGLGILYLSRRRS
jgi:hypothetical protein